MSHIRIGPPSKLSPAAATGLIATLLYSPMLAQPFLSEGGNVIDLLSRRGPWLDFIGPQYGLHTVSFYRPLLSLSLWIDLQVWSQSPFGYRLTNLMLLGLAVWLLCRVAIKLEVPPGLAMAIGLGWAWSVSLPAQVCWTVGRSDLLMTILVLAATLFLLHGKAALSICALVGACLAKETAYGLLLLIVPLLGITRGWKRAAPAAAALVGVWTVRRLALGSWIGGYAGGHGVIPELADLLGLGAALGRTLVPVSGLVGLGLLVGLTAAVLLTRDRPAAWLLAASLAATLPLSQQWSEADNSLLLRLYGLALAFLVLTMGRLASLLVHRRPRIRYAHSFLGAAVFLWAAQSAIGGGLPGLSDHLEGGRRIRAADAAVASRADIEVDLLLLAGTTKSIGSASVHNLGVAERYSVLLPTEVPVWPLHKVMQWGGAWGTPDRQSLEAVPFVASEGQLTIEGPREVLLDSSGLADMLSGALPYSWVVDSRAHVAVLLTPLGQNQVIWSAPNADLETLLTTSLGPSRPALATTLIYSLDLGGREAWIFFADAEGHRTPAIRLHLTAEVVQQLLGGQGR